MLRLIEQGVHEGEDIIMGMMSVMVVFHHDDGKVMEVAVCLGLLLVYTVILFLTFLTFFWSLLLAVNKMLRSFCGFYLKDYMMT